MPAAVASKTDMIARPRLVATILAGGLLAGLLDGADAVVFYGLAAGTTPAQIFQYIASGLLGPKAFAGGWHTVALGIVLHFLIAIGAASVFCVATLLRPALLQRPWLWGPLFGVAVYFFMQKLVIPLSLVPQRPHPIFSVEFADVMASHMLLVGFPIAWIARQASYPVRSCSVRSSEFISSGVRGRRSRPH
jgi:hypothetical protein